MGLRAWREWVAESLKGGAAAEHNFVKGRAMWGVARLARTGAEPSAGCPMGELRELQGKWGDLWCDGQAAAEGDWAAELVESFDGLPRLRRVTGEGLKEASKPLGLAPQGPPTGSTQRPSSTCRPMA